MFMLLADGPTCLLLQSGRVWRRGSARLRRSPKRTMGLWWLSFGESCTLSGQNSRCGIPSTKRLEECDSKNPSVPKCPPPCLDVSFCPTFHAKSPKSIFGDFPGFSSIFRSISVDVLSCSISFSQFKSVSVNFNEFHSV